MKFICSAEINVPFEQAIASFKNQEDLKHWHVGFISKEILTGLPNQPGTKSKIIYHNNNSVIELIETILTPQTPNQISALYEHKHLVNVMTAYFSSIGSHKTRLGLEIHYTKFIGLMPKLMALLLPGLFRKQTQKMVDNFKVYAESETANH